MRNNKGKRIISLCCAFTIVLATVIALNYILRPVDTDGAYSQIETFHSLPDNSLEVIVYGSSVAFQGVSTMELYRQYGIGAYNYAWHWQKANTTRAFIEDSFESQSPKVILVETFNFYMALEDTDLCGESYYPRYLHSKNAKKWLLSQYLGSNPTLDRKVSYLFPFYMFHSNWGNITLDSFKPLSVDPKLRKTMGFSESNEIVPTYVPDYSNAEQLEFSQTMISELDAIVEMCKKKNTKVVFFTCPWGGERNFSNAYREYCQKNDCMYIDLFEKYEETGIDGQQDFADVWHLNKTGAIKVSDYIGKILVDNYELTDMRLIPDNLWEQVL